MIGFITEMLKSLLYLISSAPALLIADIGYRGCDGVAGFLFKADGFSSIWTQLQQETPIFIVLIVQLTGTRQSFFVRDEIIRGNLYKLCNWLTSKPTSIRWVFKSGNRMLTRQIEHDSSFVFFFWRAVQIQCRAKKINISPDLTQHAMVPSLLHTENFVNNRKAKLKNQ